MKIRIDRNNIRFRLKQTEVRRFAEEKYLNHSLQFGADPGQQICFILEQSDGYSMAVRFRDNYITISIPAAMSKTWTETELVGLEENVETEPGITVGILIEKDFACLDGSDADNADTFPNPNAVCNV